MSSSICVAMSRHTTDIHLIGDLDGGAATALLDTVRAVARHGASAVLLHVDSTAPGAAAGAPTGAPARLREAS